MSQKLADVFKRIQSNKKDASEIKKIYKDVLSVTGEYQEVLENIEVLKLRKKKIEAGVQADYKEEFDRLEGLKLNISSDSQLLSDIALTELVAGDTVVNIIDENKVEYEPSFSVKFKKN